MKKFATITVIGRDKTGVVARITRDGGVGKTIRTCGADDEVSQLADDGVELVHAITRHIADGDSGGRRALDEGEGLRHHLVRM